MRLTVASAVVETDPTLAIELAPAAPDALVSAAMASVGEAAAKGGNPDDLTLQQMRAVALADPLRTEPFLLEAALAERKADYDKAKSLLVEARTRDPRSIATRYLYADTLIRQGNVYDGLVEMAVLSRLLPGSATQLVPALAEFAKTPGAREKLSSMLAQNPQLKNPLLLSLAADPDNADLIVALAGPPTPNPSTDTRAWQTRLLLGLVARGDYQGARKLWSGFARIPDSHSQLLVNGSFRKIAAPPPFNWAFSASAAGVTEPGPHRLRVLYYGRQDTLLASQLLTLPAGTYRFQAPTTGDVVAGSLSWTVTCVGAKMPIMTLGVGSSGQPGTLTVPAEGCPAQWLQLNGHQEESPEDSDVRIGPATLERVVQ